MKTKLLTSSLILLLAGSSLARTWTSSDGSKTFEGDYLSSKDGNVTVLKNGSKLTFKLELLSEADQEYVKAEAKKAAAEEANKAAAAEFKESDFGKAFKKLQKLDGKSFAKHELECAPEFFILYFSASW
ncbi:MAG: hypothetical protein ACON38_04130 [Akkermansiaceae bacterium]